jgi:hypothetical protein
VITTRSGSSSIAAPIPSSVRAKATPRCTRRRRAGTWRW